jgi:L-iditol 2-dehydrogenase
LPDSVSDEAAALLEPLSVDIWACRKARIVPGSRVGVITAQTARAFGAAEIIVSDPVADRRQLVERIGATRTLDPAAEDVADLGVGAFIDASGATPAVISGITGVRGAGVVVLVGMGADQIALPIPVIQNNAEQNPGSLKTMDVPA